LQRHQISKLLGPLVMAAHAASLAFESDILKSSLNENARQ
jgi:hypothetical protein